MRSLLPIALLLVSGFAQADSVTPSARAKNGLTAYAQPQISVSIGRLNPGERAELLGSVPGWYKLQLKSGKTGFVNKSWATVVRDAGPPSAGGTTTNVPLSYVVDVIDVGTGLSILVTGDDFALIYDGGSNDDTALGDSNRLIAFLKAAWPKLKTINHVILSHPHRDHVELLADVFSRYRVSEVWDSGRLNDICGYRAFLYAISIEPGAIYHDAKDLPGVHAVDFKKRSCPGRGDLPTSITLNTGDMIETGQPVTLGKGASMTFLHADAGNYPDINDNSLVVRMDLGSSRVLFMGDAGGGGRAVISDPPKPGSIEKTLLDCCADAIRADVLIAGHHGSKTSSRSAFINQVGARYYVISAGPTKYSNVVLPDSEVVNELADEGDLYRTDLSDDECRHAAKKIGPDDDNKPGGCDNIRITLGNGEPAIEYLNISD